jgi:phage terminase large subunit-like protein
LSEDQEFQPHYFKVRTQEEVARLNTRNFLTIDTAISQKAHADFTGFCDNSVDTQNFWNLKAWRMKLGPKELIDMLFTLQDRRHYEKIGIEKTIYLQAIKPFLDEEMRKRNKFLPIVELQHNQIQKETRIRGLLPRYESGSIFHIEGACRDLEEEALVFPQGVHDDVLDSTAYQLQIAEQGFYDPLEELRIYHNRQRGDMFR